ncbi:MAG: hypothetical protein ACFB9M_06725 [Myxococcota bacterium]
MRWVRGAILFARDEFAKTWGLRALLLVGAGATAVLSSRWLVMQALATVEAGGSVTKRWILEGPDPGSAWQGPLAKHGLGALGQWIPFLELVTEGVLTPPAAAFAFFATQLLPWVCLACSFAAIAAEAQAGHHAFFFLRVDRSAYLVGRWFGLTISVALFWVGAAVVHGLMWRPPLHLLLRDAGQLSWTLVILSAGYLAFGVAISAWVPRPRRAMVAGAVLLILLPTMVWGASSWWPPARGFWIAQHSQGMLALNAEASALGLLYGLGWLGLGTLALRRLG